MSRELNKLMRSFLTAAAGEYRDTCWCPAVDLYQGNNVWLAKFDLAGVRCEDLQIEFRERRLTVRGMRRDATIIEGRVAYSMEISYNSFERTVELPFQVEQAAIETEYHDGMLLIYIKPGATKS